MMLASMFKAAVPPRDPTPTLDKPGAFARATGGHEKYLGPKKRLLTFIYFFGQSAVPVDTCYGANLKPANAFSRERKKR